MVKPAIRIYNGANPELRLKEYPFWPLSESKPIPNLRICADVFSRCRAAQGGEDAAPTVGDLLLEFERDHPVEWECSGWKNDLIAELMLGRTNSGDDIERRRHAEYWFTRHWAQEKESVRQRSIENSDTRRRAWWAAVELEYLKANSKLKQPDQSANLAGTKASPDTHPEPPPSDGFWGSMGKAFAESIANMKPTNDRRESYNLYAAVVVWLTDNVPNLAYEPGSLRFVRAAVLKFQRERPNFKLADSVLAEISAAFGRCYKPARENKKIAYKVAPSKVILDIVANRHGVSTGLVGKVRAELNKKNAQS